MRCDATMESVEDGVELQLLLRECELIPGDPPLKVWESRFVFVDGTGCRVWPATACLAAYLRATGLNSDAWGGMEAAPEGGKRVDWRGRRVAELGCGVGALSIALAQWGCERVVAVDTSLKALALAKRNLEVEQGSASASSASAARKAVTLHRLDWHDVTACQDLRKDLGPFDAIVVADGVLVGPPGPMWLRGEGGVEAAPLASMPGPLLDATRELAHGGTEVVLAVTDRCGDTRETARALLARRHLIELVSTPQVVPQAQNDRGSPVTIFHFRWKERAGTGGEVTRQLWQTV